MLFRKLKVGQLARILVNRNTISKEQYFSFILIDDLSRFPRERWDCLLDNRFSFWTGYRKRALVKILYQQGFLDKIEYNYHNHILPYAINHSLISLFRSK